MRIVRLPSDCVLTRDLFETYKTRDNADASFLIVRMTTASRVNTAQGDTPCGIATLVILRAVAGSSLAVPVGSCDYAQDDGAAAFLRIVSTSMSIASVPQNT